MGNGSFVAQPFPYVAQFSRQIAPPSASIFLDSIPMWGEGFIPPGLCAHIAAQHKKAGANISFAPAVLLLRSHSLITLFRYFSDCFRIVMGIILSFCEFWLPFQDLTNCSLDLPSGSLFAQKHLWNGVMFVIKIVLGVVGLMPRTKAS